MSCRFNEDIAYRDIVYLNINHCYTAARGRDNKKKRYYISICLDVMDEMDGADGWIGRPPPCLRFYRYQRNYISVVVANPIQSDTPTVAISYKKKEDRKPFTYKYI